MKLEARDRQYVKLLFREGCTKSEEERDKLKSQRRLLRSSRNNETHKQDEQMQIVGHRLAWYIKMGSIFFDGKSRSEIIKSVVTNSRFPVSEREADQALDILLAARQLQFVDGLSQFEGSSILTKWDFDSHSIKTHHASNLSLAIDSLKWPVNHRFHTGVTVACSEDFYQNIISEVRALCMSILDRAEQNSLSIDETSKVVTLQRGLFPFFTFPAPL
jgi:hypothetical protein